MSLDAQSAAVVAAVNARFPKLGTEVLDAARARELLARNPAVPSPGREVAEVGEDLVEGAGGTPPIRVRWYRPRTTSEPLPAIVFAHGGGFVICGLDTHDAVCRDLSVLCDAVVVSVEYRLAPEARFPAAADDVLNATRWVVERAEHLGVDPTRVAVAGDSAGGNLAAVTALRARDEGGPALAAQLLVYPMLDTDFTTESYRRNGNDPQLTSVTEDHLRWYWLQYLGTETSDDPSAVPARAALHDLPPTILVTAEHCPLLSENLAHADRLRRAGSPVTVQHHVGVTHGFYTLGHAIDTGRRAVEDSCALLREVLHG